MQNHRLTPVTMACDTHPCATPDPLNTSQLTDLPGYNVTTSLAMAALPGLPGTVDVPYIVIELLVALLAVVGNLLVIIVFMKHPAIRTTTNYYILSLVTADLLVGSLGIPFAIATSLGLPRNFHACIVMSSLLLLLCTASIFVFSIACIVMSSLLLLLCTASIFSLVAVSIDRFWAIQWPLTYPVHMTERAALAAICVSWSLAAVVGSLPSLGWNNGHPPVPRCLFMEVMDMRYLATLYFTTILLPVVVMAFVYGAIYKAVHKQIRRMSIDMYPSKNSPKNCLQAKTKAAKTLFVIVILFCVSWIPLYTFNALVCFCPGCGAAMPVRVIKGLIILSHCNSAWNPLLYAWGMRDFRAALGTVIARTGYTKYLVVFTTRIRRGVTGEREVVAINRKTGEVVASEDNIRML